jgi:hypothetical protein
MLHQYLAGYLLSGTSGSGCQTKPFLRTLIPNRTCSEADGSQWPEIKMQKKEVHANMERNNSLKITYACACMWSLTVRFQRP